MALIRRCGRFMWIQMKLPKLTEKHMTRILDNTPNEHTTHVLQPTLQIRTNSQYKVNKSYSTSKVITSDQQSTDASSNPEETTEMCYSDIKQLIEKTRAQSTPLGQSFALRLLKSCHDMLPDSELSQRQDLVHQAWNLIESLVQTLTVEHYNILLSIYAKNSQHLDVKGFLSTMKVEPDKNTYRLLMNVLAEVGDYSQILMIIAKMKDMGYPVNEAMFNALVLAYMVNGDVDGAQSVVNTMDAAMIEMSPATYCALSRGYAAKGDKINLIRNLKAGNLNTEQLMLVVKSLSKSNNAKFIRQVIDYLPNGVNVQRSDIICTIVELTHSGKARDALELINCLPSVETPKDSPVHVLDFFLHELVQSETSDKDILEICENLAASERHPSPLLKFTEVALRSKKEDTALFAFAMLENQGIEIRPHFYWPLLINAAVDKTESDVMELIKHMTKHKIYVDYETLKNYMIPFLSSTDPVTIVRKLQDCGLKTADILTILFSTLLLDGKLQEAASLSRKMSGNIDKTVVIESLLQGYTMAKNVDAATELLNHIKSSEEQNGNFLLDLLANKRMIVTSEELKLLITAFDKKNLRISKSCAEALKPRIDRINDPENFSETFERLISTKKGSTEEWAPIIPHPRFMSAEQLEDHFTDLSNSGGNTRGVLRRLIQTYCRKNDLSKAIKYAKIFDEKGFDWTTGMLSAMFYLCTLNDNLEEAEMRYRELQTRYKDFRIDDFKIIDYATILVNHNKLQKALKVLNEQQNVRCGPATIRNCWRLLKAVATASDPEDVKTTLDLLINKGYCEIDNRILGPLIQSYLVSGKLEAAITQFKHYAQTFRKAPLKQELLRAIVLSSKPDPENQKQLMEVLTVVKEIHGDSAATSHLFMALAATNRQKELRSLITMPRFNESILTLCVEKFVGEKDLAALQTILKACRGLERLDTMIIYDSILSICSRSGDYETALQTWEKIRIENVTPSAQLTAKLKSLLNAHKVPIPSELS